MEVCVDSANLVGIVDVIEKVDARAAEIREIGKATLEEAAAAKEEKHE